MSTQEHPWSAAKMREGIVPGQGILYPRPVILDCDDCGMTGFWYPAENRIDVRRMGCARIDPAAEYGNYDADPIRPRGHAWTLESWNGNEPVAADLPERDA